jgi:hypothetical protein
MNAKDTDISPLDTTPYDPDTTKPWLPCATHGRYTRHVYAGGAAAAKTNGVPDGGKKEPPTTEWIYRCDEDGCHTHRVWGISFHTPLTKFRLRRMHAVN